MKPKVESTESKNWLDDTLDRIEKRRGTYVKSRFYVVEVTPPKRYARGDGHGGTDWDWTRQRIARVSEYFTSRPQAEDFLNAHEPDEGKTLETREDKLYRRTVEEWF